MSRTFITGASIVTSDVVLSGTTLVLRDGVIDDLIPEEIGGDALTDRVVDATGLIIVPGFIDVHAHGLLGVDVLDDEDAVARVAALMPRYGTTAFCPTSVACPPQVLGRFLEGVRQCRRVPPAGAARVVAAHLESNFISPDFKGAQPLEYLCSPAGQAVGFSGEDIVRVIDSHRDAVGIVTLAPEIVGGLDLVQQLVVAGIRVSLGHTGATFAESRSAIEAGATRATHLFSAMRPFTHREPGVIGAVLTDSAVAVEVICDGVHAHPASVRLALATKPESKVIAITDATAASGLPRGTRSHLGMRPVIALDAARYDDGSLAGSVATMDSVFRTLVHDCGCDLVQAARATSANPAADLGLSRYGRIGKGLAADFVMLSPELALHSTWIGGRPVWNAEAQSLSASLLG